MATVLGLLAALTYGAGDFMAGLAGRRIPPAVIAWLVLCAGVLTAAVAVAVAGGHGPTARVLAWGGGSGLGSGIGTLALYQGLARGRMSVVAPLSAVLAAVVAALVGVALGNHLSPTAAAGIVLAVPAIAVVSRPPSEPDEPGARSSGAGSGLLAGCGFALLFVGLDRAGTHSGAWPMLAGQVVASLVVAPFAVLGLREARIQRLGRPPGTGLVLVAMAGVLSAAANLLYLEATGEGELAIVAVLTSLYPGVTVVLARVLLHERWSRPQLGGLIVAAVAVVLVQF